jgi:hypothetical protein
LQSPTRWNEVGRRFELRREPRGADRPSAAQDKHLATCRSGPIIVEMEYRVASDRARSFYASMLKVRSARSRNGAFAWSLARDISAPELWVERFTCPI